MNFTQKKPHISVKLLCSGKYRIIEPK